jgi:hypothetical protein
MVDTMGNAVNRKVIYQNCNGQEFDAHLLGGTDLGAHLLVDIDGAPVILRRVAWFGDAHPGGEHWRYASPNDELDDVPVVRRTGDLPAIQDCECHEWRDGEATG